MKGDDGGDGGRGAMERKEDKERWRGEEAMTEGGRGRLWVAAGVLVPCLDCLLPSPPYFNFFP